MTTNTNAKINRQKFQLLIGKHNWTAKDFWDRWTKKYGFTIIYNSFMELLNNNVSWKLVYAFSVADMLEVDINELFDFHKEEI